MGIASANGLRVAASVCVAIVKRTRIKICGITRPEDGVEAASAGADAIGLVFYSASPRFVDIGRAKHIVEALPPFVSKVALFVNAPEQEVKRVLDTLPIDCLQFHGDEGPAYCRSFARPFLKAIRIKPGVDLLEYARSFQFASGLLLDAFVEGVPGGTGARFDWSLIPEAMPIPIVLSGGLDPANVGEAVRSVRPWAVDVSSGVEAAKGIKDREKIIEFVRGVRNADLRSA